MILEPRNPDDAMQIPRREYKNREMLSIIGFGGILCLGRSPAETSRFIGEVFERGVNYFDVAPSYGGGEAEEKMGPALSPYRSRVFLACKTMMRDAKGAGEELERSLRRLKTGHFDLYQLHAVTTLKEVEDIFGPGGAFESLVRARERGLIRYIGFSAHSETAALKMLGRFTFDSVLFPFNVVCSVKGNFGPGILESARSHGVARLALKAMAYSPLARGEVNAWPKCWYRPIDDPALAELALRYTLGQDVTAALPPGEEALFRIAMEGALRYTPLSEGELKELIARTESAAPLFRRESA